jgi:hypothetical protein
MATWLSAVAMGGVAALGGGGEIERSRLIMMAKVTDYGQ